MEIVSVNEFVTERAARFKRHPNQVVGRPFRVDDFAAEPDSRVQVGGIDGDE